MILDPYLNNKTMLEHNESYLDQQHTYISRYMRSLKFLSSLVYDILISKVCTY